MPNPAPVLESMARTAVMVLSISSPWKDRMRQEKRKIVIYIRINTVIPETTGAEMAFFPTLTATTERGCILLMQPLQISFSMTMIRITLMEPEVEAAQPPMNIKVISTNWHTAGHIRYGERV